MKKRIFIRIIITIFLLFGVESCSVFMGATYEMNPCFHLDNEEMKKECYKWRANYPKEYNRFYDNVKRKYIDSVYLTLPERVHYIIKDDKVIPLQ